MDLKLVVPSGRASPRPLLFLVEGRHDVEFLRRLTGRLSTESPGIPNLSTLELEGQVVFLPFGGGDVLAWSTRLAPLGCAEFHLYDRELPPETNLRRQAIEAVNSRPCCRAFLTSKRSLENYLHPTAIIAAGGPSVEYGDDDPVAEFVARAKFVGHNLKWNSLSRRSRARCANRAKKWLNTVAVEYMSSDLLAERDPHGEIRGWFRQISALLKTSSAD
jgi:putative ATP-dependent endonuclease of OLD family